MKQVIARKIRTDKTLCIHVFLHSKIITKEYNLKTKSSLMQPNFKSTTSTINYQQFVLKLKKCIACFQ